LWQNITPPELIGNETAALKVVSGARYLLGKYTGVPSVASLLLTGLQWVSPNPSASVRASHLRVWVRFVLNANPE
jgi:hypothetical protein